MDELLNTMSESKYVQTELTNEEYRYFKTLAEERDLSLTTALHEAAEYWIEKQHEVDPNDPLFDILSELDQEPVPDTPRTNAANEGDLIEEWNGADAGIRFPESRNREE